MTSRRALFTLPLLLLPVSRSSGQSLTASPPSVAIAPESAAPARILGWVVRIVPDRTISVRTGDRRELEWSLRSGTPLPAGIDTGDLVRVGTARSEWGTVEAVAVDVLRSDDDGAPGSPAADRQAGPFPGEVPAAAVAFDAAPPDSAPAAVDPPTAGLRAPLDGVWFASSTPLRARVVAVERSGLRIRRADGSVELARPIRAGTIPGDVRAGSVVDLYGSRGNSGELLLRRVLIVRPTRRVNPR